MTALATSRGDEPLRSLTAATALTVAAAMVLVVGVTFWSALEADRATKATLLTTVTNAINDGAEQIPYDQESVAIWDDAVVNSTIAFDEKWVDENLGVWMYDYFRHNRVEVLDANNQILYAMAGGKRLPIINRRPPLAVASMARKLRGAMSGGALDDYVSGKTRIPRQMDFAIVEQRPAIVSVMPIIPHSSAVVQEAGKEPLIASVRFLDRDFLTSLAKKYQLGGVRYTPVNAIRSYEQSYPIRTASGQVLGYIVWSPKLAGSDIMWKVLPVLAIGMTFISFAIAALVRHLKRVYAELVTNEAQARHLAYHDPLTGLANRAYFNAQLKDSLADTAETRAKTALLFLDLDRFKNVNDTLGHAAGDALIRELANILSRAVGRDDVVARMGGDEFAILLRNVGGRPEIDVVCQDIIASISRPFEVLGGQAVVGISIGIAVAPPDGMDRSELARKADVALYEAKRRGGQTFVFFQPELTVAAERQRELKGDLGRAIEGGEIDVVYQPIYEKGTLAIVGAEALARWSHPTLGAVSPLVFVALAEDCGLIDQLGELVLRRACSFAMPLDLDIVSINVSALQCMKPNFADSVLRILKETGLPPSRLEIEVTERALLDGTSNGSGALKALRNCGVRIALDDFGTGKSSLGSLIKLEVDRIKLDRCLVRPLGESAQGRSIVEAIIHMAHAGGIAVTAEGVETSEQLSQLSRMGVDQLQGHLLSPAISALRLIDMLRRGPDNASRPERSVA